MKPMAWDIDKRIEQDRQAGLFPEEYLEQVKQNYKRLQAAGMIGTGTDFLAALADEEKVEWAQKTVESFKHWFEEGPAQWLQDAASAATDYFREFLDTIQQPAVAQIVDVPGQVLALAAAPAAEVGTLEPQSIMASFLGAGKRENFYLKVFPIYRSGRPYLLDPDDKEEILVAEFPNSMRGHKAQILYLDKENWTLRAYNGEIDADGSFHHKFVLNLPAARNLVENDDETLKIQVF